MSSDIKKIVVSELSPIAGKDTDVYTALKRMTEQLNAIADEINLIRARLTAGHL